MYDYLDAKRYAETDNCEVFVETLEVPPDSTTSGSHRAVRILWTRTTMTMGINTALLFATFLL